MPAVGGCLPSFREGRRSERLLWRPPCCWQTAWKRRDNENNALGNGDLLETREKERQIEQQAEELKWHRTLTTVAGGILFLICVIFLLVVRHSRIVGRKNKLMAQQIELYLSYRTKLDTAQLRINQLEEMLAEQTKVNTDSKEEKEKIYRHTWGT